MCLVDIAQHLEADEMVVMHHLVGWVLDIKTEQVLENTDVESVPVLVENVGS